MALRLFFSPRVCLARVCSYGKGTQHQHHHCKICAATSHRHPQQGAAGRAGTRGATRRMPHALPHIENNDSSASAATHRPRSPHKDTAHTPLTHSRAMDCTASGAQQG